MNKILLQTSPTALTSPLAVARLRVHASATMVNIKRTDSLDDEGEPDAKARNSRSIRRRLRGPLEVEVYFIRRERNGVAPRQGEREERTYTNGATKERNPCLDTSVP